MSDFLWYYQAGSKLEASHAYPTAWRPIGYPLMLGMVFRVLGTSPLAARLLNVALSVGIL
ncbi:MAG: hypothetical protein HY775_06095, partial [Acidobacteria bacterium]|nr:hypothetical protein [Acidobacteriota bacterium]